MNIITDAPVVVNGEVKKTSFTDSEKAEFSEAGNYDFMKKEFEEGFYSLDGESYYFDEANSCFYANDSEYFSGKKAVKKVKTGVKKTGKVIGKAAVKTGKAVVKAEKFVAASLKKFIGKFKPKKNAIPVTKIEKSAAVAIQGSTVKAIPKPIDTKGAGYKSVDTSKKESVYIQPLPKLSKTAEGMVKTNDDGTKTVVPPSQVKTGPDGKQYDAKDLQSEGETKLIKNEATGLMQAVKVLAGSAILPLTTEDGEVINFKKSDVVDKETGKEPFLTKNMKIVIGVGVGIIILSTTLYFVFRNKKGKK